MAATNQGHAVAALAGRAPGLVAQEELWLDVLKLAAAVESMVHDAARAIHEDRDELVRAVRDQEPAIDEWEVCIEKECLRVLTRYEPVASDLRRTLGVLKLRAQLERVGDLATKIARRSQRLHRSAAAPPIPASLGALARMSVERLEQVIAALHSDDADAARALIVGDREIDRQYRATLKELKVSMRHQPECVSDLLLLANTARNWERVGDHTVSIANAILFIRG